MNQMGAVIKPWIYFIMSKPENNDGETSKHIKTILIVIVCVITWIILQSILGIPLKM
jgi:hypothetical protein